MSDINNTNDGNDLDLFAEPVHVGQSNGTMGEVTGTGAGLISGGVVGAAVAGPVGAAIGAVLGGVLGAAAGGAAHDIGEDMNDDHGPQAADASRFHSASESIASPGVPDFPLGQPFGGTEADTDADEDFVAREAAKREAVANDDAAGDDAASSGPSEAERVMLPPGV